jgi:hypothetical protein
LACIFPYFSREIHNWKPEQMKSLSPNQVTAANRRGLLQFVAAGYSIGSVGSSHSAYTGR